MTIREDGTKMSNRIGNFIHHYNKSVKQVGMPFDAISRSIVNDLDHAPLELLQIVYYIIYKDRVECWLCAIIWSILHIPIASSLCHICIVCEAIVAWALGAFYFGAVRILQKDVGMHKHPPFYNAGNNCTIHETSSLLKV